MITLNIKETKKNKVKYFSKTFLIADCIFVVVMSPIVTEMLMYGEMVSGRKMKALVVTAFNVQL